MDPGILTTEELRSCGEHSGIQVLWWSAVLWALQTCQNPRKEVQNGLLPSGPSGYFLAPSSLQFVFINNLTACRSPLQATQDWCFEFQKWSQLCLAAAAKEIVFVFLYCLPASKKNFWAMSKGSPELCLQVFCWFWFFRFFLQQLQK